MELLTAGKEAVYPFNVHHPQNLILQKPSTYKEHIKADLISLLVVKVFSYKQRVVTVTTNIFLQFLGKCSTL